MKILKNKKKTLWFAVSGSILLLIFYLFSFIVKSHALDSFDFNTTVRLQNHLPLRFDPFFSFLSLIGSFEITAIILFVILLARKKLVSVFTSFFLFLGAHVVEIFGKTFLHHPPPPHLFLRFNLGFSFPSSYVQPGSSYPSGHSLRILFLTVIVWFIIAGSKKLSKNQKYVAIAAMALFTFLMLISRVSLGEHWSTDVIGGSIFGAGVALFALPFLLQ